MQVNLTANGATAPVQWSGGEGAAYAWGTFGGGTVTLQLSPDGGTTWFNVDRPGDTYVTFAANGTGGFKLGLCKLRFVLAGSTAPNVWVSL